MSILEKIKKNTTIKDSAILAQSKFFTRKDMVPTSIPIINVALSGRMDGGLTPGLTMWAGPSKHFKTAFSLLMARSYLDKYPDAALLFYDSEFGTPQSYFDSFGIDTNRVLHTPITDLEQLKFDIMQQMDNIDRGDRVMIVIDSIGNLASKKEVQDALDGKSVADMSRAKQIKSLFRMVTPHLTIKDIPLVVVNHTYMEQCLAATKAANEAAEVAQNVEPQKDTIQFDDFQKMDIRVSTILAAEKVAKTKKLLKLTIDTGIDKREIVSGIAEHFTPEELVGQQVLVLVNLAPRELKGILSNGMILMAEDASGKLRLLQPGEATHNGAVVG
jgi:methionine--tRNA ligase beta chain